MALFQNLKCSRSYVAVLIVQLLVILPFALLSIFWSRISNVLTDPSFSADLTRLIPGILSRYNIGMTLAFIVFSIFSFLQSKNVERINARQIALLACLAFFFFWQIALCILQFPICTDDTYIDFRYVYKWVNGLGFDYNVNQRIMGFSSPLHLALLSLTCLIFNRHDIALVSQMLNAALIGASYLLLFQTTRRSFQSDALAVLAAVIFATSPLNLSHSIIGKEGPLVILLMIASFWASTLEKPSLLAWSAAALAMTRPEGLIWYIAAFICRLVKAGKPGMKIWLLPSIVLAIFYACLYFYFGTLMPHGAIGRATMFHAIWEASDLTCFYILEHCGAETFAHSLAVIFAPNLETYKIAWALQGCIAFLLLFELSRRNKWLTMYACASIALLFFFAWFNPWVFPWYYSWFALVAPLVIPLVARAVCPLLKNLKAYPSMLFVSGLCLLCTVSAFIADLPPARLMFLGEHGIEATIWPMFKTLRSYPFAWGEGQERLLLYKKAAEYLSHRPGTLATWEPGLLGYLMPERQILDLGGLLSNDVLKFYPVPVGQRTRMIVWGSIPPESVVELKPDWVIFLDSFADNGLLSDNRFLETYDLEKFWPGKIWGGNGVYLYRRASDSEGKPSQPGKQESPHAET